MTTTIGESLSAKFQAMISTENTAEEQKSVEPKTEDKSDINSDLKEALHEARQDFLLVR